VRVRKRADAWFGLLYSSSSQPAATRQGNAAESRVIPVTPDPHWKGAAPDEWIRLVKALERYTRPYERDLSIGGPFRLLRTARSLYLHSWYVADFGAVAVLVANQAVEAAFHILYPHRESDSFEALIRQAAADGHLQGDHVAWVHDLRAMRNVLSHPVDQVSALGVGRPASFLWYAHQIVIQVINAAGPHWRSARFVEAALRREKSSSRTPPRQDEPPDVAP
jgi:hypothetical protein